MGKFPTYEEMGKKVVEKALDEILYDDKSIREWMQIIASEDCISRQAVLDLVNADWKYEGLETDVASLPPVTPQQKMGRWILSGGYWRCSECKEKALLKFDKSKGGCREYEPVRSKHCPSCGIKMQESKEIGEIHCNHTDTEIAKSFIEDVEAVKELLPKAGK